MTPSVLANDLLAISVTDAEMAILFAPDSMLRRMAAADPTLKGELVIMTPDNLSRASPSVKEEGWLIYIFDQAFDAIMDAADSHLLEAELKQHVYAHVEPPPVEA